ncbi:glycoside hydrolase family 16 protein [Chitinophaga sp. 22321]|uniref:Glycoside hydrolase family 16 protein n=1 Tax=Chitinophaga hostae TaxID=2831022 RepID=A0ABS5J4C5_9BACT|nr:glycoside hydrolase family 16 protein [Chitinophaga hostae]MBS0030071.1 glycoside hydrolase family 16 protein [Chitinophaga hostae]
MKKNVLLLLIIAVSMLACKVTTRSGKHGYLYTQKAGRAEKQWKLVWQDNFDGPRLDTGKWTRIPPNNAAWGRHMTSDDRCYQLDSGKLYLRGINNPDTLKDPRPFLTGGIYSKGKFAFQYGKIEIRAKLECAQGAWPAMWMLAETDRYGHYPKNGEIDIMEHLNYDSIFYQTTHSYYTLNLKQTDHPPHYGTAALNPLDFNTFGISWYPDKIVFHLNGKPTFTYPRVQGVDPSQWPYDQPFYLLIDQQLAGDWVGKVNPGTLPVQMIVDWVKVYQ